MPAAKQVRMRRGSALDNDLFTGAEGEITIDNSINTVRVHDGVTLGGTALALADLANIPENTEFEQRIMDAVQALVAAGGGAGGGEEAMAIGDVKTSFANPGEDYLPADGTLLSTTAYPALYAAIGQRYGTDGAGGYSVPIVTTAPSLTGMAGKYQDFAVNGNTVVIALVEAGGYMVSTDDGKTFGIFNDGSAIATSKIAFAAGKFVAVGTGKIATSSDGKTWTVKTDLTNAFSSLWVLNNRFFVFSITGSYTSTDGTTWTPVTIPSFTNAVPLSAGYSAFLGMYLFGGATGALSTSTDGINWTARTSNMTNNIYGIDSNSSVVVLAGGNISTTANFATSPDGVTWTARTNTVGQSRNCLAWVPAMNLFVSGGLAGVGATSPDGVTWTTIASGSFGTAATACNQILVTPTSVLTIGVNTYGYSANTATWTNKFSPNNPYRGITKALVSSNGSIWFMGNHSTLLGTSINKSTDAGVSTYNLHQALSFSSLTSVVDGTRQVASIGTKTVYQIAKSLNVSGSGDQAPGATFCYDQVTGLTTQVYTGVAASTGASIPFGQGYMLASNTKLVSFKTFLVQYGSGVSTSTDGVNWKMSFGIPATVNIMALEYNGTVMVAVGSTGGIYSSSDMGVTWTAATWTGANPYTGLIVTSVMWNKYVQKWLAIASTSSVLAASDNGTTWSNIATLPGVVGTQSVSQYPKIVATSKYVAVKLVTSAIVTAANADIATSAKWTAVQMPLTPSLSVGFDASPDVFVTVGTLNSVPYSYSSPDGINWTGAAMPLPAGVTTGTATGVLWTGQGFIAIGTLAAGTTPGFWTSRNSYYWLNKTAPTTTSIPMITVTQSGSEVFAYGSSQSGTSFVVGQFHLAPDGTFRVPTIVAASAATPDSYIKVK